MKILHVTEAYGGGVVSAINSYVLNSSQFEHYLFAAIRNKDVTGEESIGVFKEIYFVERTFSLITELRTVIEKLAPDVIHIHSTYAGFLCRLLPFISNNKSVYTPHGYAFLRDDHPILLKAFYAAEKLLANRTRLIAGCGREEKNIAAKFVGSTRAIELINVCDPLPDIAPIYSMVELPVIGMIGRVSNQKGYVYFNKVAQQLKGVAHFKWIGGGDAQREELLQANGVEVTGWITRNEVIGHLKGLDLYLHTAAWEGFPISVLEAAQLKKPMMLRGIGPFIAEDLPVLKNEADAVCQIRKWLSGDELVCQSSHSVIAKINSYHSFDHLKQALNALYSTFK